MFILYCWLTCEYTVSLDTLLFCLRTPFDGILLVSCSSLASCCSGVHLSLSFFTVQLLKTTSTASEATSRFGIWLIVYEIYTRTFHALMCSVSAHREVLLLPALVVQLGGSDFLEKSHPAGKAKWVELDGSPDLGEG